MDEIFIYPRKSKIKIYKSEKQKKKKHIKLIKSEKYIQKNTSYCVKESIIYKQIKNK